MATDGLRFGKVEPPVTPASWEPGGASGGWHHAHQTLQVISRGCRAIPDRFGLGTLLMNTWEISKEISHL
jgi:hypothetical protein